MYSSLLRRSYPRHLLRSSLRRHESSLPPKDVSSTSSSSSPSSISSNSTSSSSSSSTTHSRFARMESRLPRFLRRYTTPLRTAPLTHISSFLLLHELTAVAPLLGLAGAFHYTQWLPPVIGEGKWVSDGVERFGRYFRRKGWLGTDVALDGDGNIVGVREGGKVGRRDVWWGRGEGGVRLVVEFATAYAITKALLPLRLILSVWATPWFARVAVVPVMNRFKGLFRRKPKT